MKLHELQEKRAAAVSAMRAMADKAESESRDYSADEETRHAGLKKEITDLDTKITRAKDIAEAERSAPAVIAGNGRDGAYEDRARSFSVTKAIAAAIGEGVDAGFEREISAEVKRRSGSRKFQGIAVPDEIFHVERRAFGDQVMLTSGVAADLYPTVHRPDLFIDKLRSALVVGRLGATVLDNLVGDQSIPRQTGSATGQWLAEDEDIDDSALNFDDVELSPKTIGAISSYSRKTLINASPSIEMIVRNDLMAVVANTIDAAAMLSAGTGNSPKGIIHQTGVAEISLASTDPDHTYEKLLEFVATVQHADADLGGLGFALNAWAVKRLRAQPRADLLAGGFIMEAPNSLLGYPAAVTSALPGIGGDSPAAATVIFGAWSQLLVGYWSGTDILVNPYAEAAYARGRVLIRVMRDCDVAVRHPESFAFADDMSVAANPES